MDTPASASPTEWCIVGKIENLQFLGQEVVFFGDGCHLYFINLTTNHHSFYRANDVSTGDGIQYYVGHSTLNFFAFAEGCGEPNIFVMTYPQFEIVSILEGGSKEGYISLTFSSTSLLISLGSLPEFEVIIWNWRRGEKMGSSRSNIHRQNQIIRCNTFYPERVAQLGLETVQLHLWDILTCGKKCIMTHHKVRLPQQKPAPLIAIRWSREGSLLVLDFFGNVYIMNSELRLERIIENNKKGNLMVSFTGWNGDVVVCGPTSEIRIYKQTTWEQYITLSPPERLTQIKANFQNILLGLSDRSYIMRIDPVNKNFDYIKSNETEFRTFCLVYPVGQYICLLSQATTVSVLEIVTGEVKSRYDLMGTALTISANPEFPYIGIGYINGILELLSVYDPCRPEPMTNFLLTNNKISSVYFSEFGRVIVAADVEVGEFFVLQGLPGGKFEVIATILANFQVVDYMLVPSSNCYRLFVIPLTSNEFSMGNQLIRYCIRNASDIRKKEYEFLNPARYYFRIVSTSKPKRDRVFYMIASNAKEIDEIEVRRGDKKARVLGSAATGHQVRWNGLYIDKFHASTWAYGGYVLARNDLNTGIGCVLPHHRRRKGVQKAIIEPLGKYIVSLGHDNILVCSSLLDAEPNYERQNELLKILNSNRYALLFKRKTVGFDPGDNLRGYTWLEVEKMHNQELEKKKCEEEKIKIMEEYCKIQTELKALLNRNLEGPENERLDLIEFNLDLQYFDEIKEANRIQCNETEMYTKRYIAALQNVCDRIKEKCYNTMQFHARKLMGIGSGVSVENYTVLPVDGAKMEQLAWVERQIILERLMNEKDTFLPWEPMTPECRNAFLKQHPIIPMAHRPEMDLLSEEQESHHFDQETAIAISGSTTQNFITVKPEKYTQLECQTFYQLMFLSMITDSDTVRLREYFNKEFETGIQLKIREMAQFKEKNQRLRHIVSEINYFSSDQIFVWIQDPQWSPYERIDELMKVEDSEVPIGPYISPSQQALLDAKAAEEERIRLLLLADDFRERALMKMMNGVLEVRWEDELKKEVPLPKCMLEKEPEEFNEDDLRAVRDYEEKVKFLNSERERYKNLLDKEYTKITSLIRESVRKFDSRLESLLLLKIKVDEAVRQEILILCKERMKLLDDLTYAEKELDLKRRMVNNDGLIHNLESIIESLQENLSDCRSQYDAIQNKEKALEKNFKKDMLEFNQIVQEASAKLVRRRPKVGFKNISSNTMLQVLAKSIITKERTSVMTDECLEYLNALDQLDTYSAGASLVEEDVYQIICKHRRLRVEHEIKVKAAWVMLAQSEATISTLQRELNFKKEQNIKAMADLNQVRTDRVKRKKNLQMQIVIKQGYVEVPMNGDISDFADAVLITREEVDNINKQILENGRVKLNTMRHTMTFHREIMKTEWLHKKMKMHIEDLKEELRDINSLKVSKEMQSHIKGKEKVLPFEVELELLKNSYEGILNEKKNGVKKLRKQVKMLKNDSKKLDKEISDINVDICEFKLDKDWELDNESRKLIEERSYTLSKRSRMVRKIQENHQTILLMQTELELLRLRTYPTIKYKILC